MIPEQAIGESARQLVLLSESAAETEQIIGALERACARPPALGCVSSLQALPAVLRARRVDALLCASSLPLQAVLDSVRQHRPGLPVLVAALGRVSAKDVVSAMRQGAAGVAEISDADGLAALLQDLPAQVATDIEAQAQAALRASEERYRSLVESTDAVITVFDAEGTVLYANAIAALPLGLSPAAILGRRMHELFPAAVADAQLATIRQVIERGAGSVSESRSIVGGQERWYRTSVQPVRDASGQVTAALINAVDITERVQTAQEIANRERYFRALIDSAHDLIVVLDAEMRLNYVSSSVQSILGLSAETFADSVSFDVQASGRAMASGAALVHPEDFMPVQQALRRLCASRDASAESLAEVRLRHADGSWRTFEMTMSNLLADPAVAGLVINARDITERRAAETALRQSEARLQSLVASQTAFNTRVDLDGRITYCNPRYQQKFAREDGQSLLGMDSMLMVAPEDRDRVRAVVYECLTHPDRPVQIELRKTLRDGSVMWTLWEFTAVLEADGAVHEVQCVGFDISKQKQAEIALQESRMLLEERVAERTVELEQVKDRLEAIFNHSGDGILLLDIDRGIQQANYAFEELLEVTRERYTGRPLDVFVSEDDAQLVRDSIAEVAATHSTRHVDVRLQPASGGAQLDIEISLAPVNRSDRSVTSLVCIIRNVSKRKAAEHALRDSETMLQNIIENIPVRLFWKDRNSVYRGCNTLHALGNGLNSPAEIIGKTDYDFLPERAGFWEMEDRRVIETGEPLLHRAEPVRLATGEHRWLSSNKVALRDSTGEAIGVLVTIEDITARKEAELAIAEERNLLRTVVDAVPDYIYVKDMQHRMLLNNLAHVKALGAGSPADLLQKTDADFFPAEMAHRFRADEEALFVTGEPLINFEESTFNTAREPIYALTTKVPLRNLQGEMIGLVGITHDVSAIKEKELALRASEERYQTTIGAMSEGLVVQESSGAIILCNAAAERILGLSEDQMRGITSVDPRWQAIHEDGSPFPGETHPAMRVLSTGQPVSNVVMGVRLPEDGSVNWILISSMPLRDAHGALLAVTTFTDITARKRAEEALRENEEKFRTFIESAPIATVIAEADGRISLVNRQAEHLFGWPREVLIGRSLTEFIPDTREYIGPAPDKNTTQTALRVGPVELTALRADTQSFPVDVQLSTIRLQPSPVIMCYAIDTTARRQAESERQALSQRLQLATQAGRIGIWDWDVINDVLIWDDQMFALYDMTREQFGATVRAYWTDVPMHPEDVVRIQQELSAVLASGKTMDMEFRLLLPNGTVRHIKANAVVFRDEDDRAVRMIGVNWDLTLLREAEASLRIALEKEKELGELKSRFVSMASHEFRTPLAAIMATTDTLRLYRERMDKEQIDARLERILQQVRYMKDIMEDVLHLARIQAGRVEFRPEAADLDVLCQEMIEEFESQAANRDRIRYTCAALPASGRFDVRLMRQVVGNLISNALKYSPENAPVLLSLERRDDRLSLKVQDAGIGIPPEDQRHLFEPFHRATNVGTISGTGLGLSITRRAVELHGGTIALESEVGVGTSFTVTIPVEPAGGSRAGGDDSAAQ